MQSQFSCYGKIHTYIRLPRRETGAHTLESRWVTPTGKVAADSRNTVDFRPAASTAYVWFAFPEGTGLPGLPNPQLDQERASFNGLWGLEVRWDEAPLFKTAFSVRCP